ncbi:MAG: hypothetical protein ACREU0_07195 [Burkholderiales bacterium]
MAKLLRRRMRTKSAPAIFQNTKMQLLECEALEKFCLICERRA